jgi:hypothetical protein
MRAIEVEQEQYSVIEGVSVDDLILRPRHVLFRWLKRVETKAGILMPQNRQRSGIMKGIVLAVGRDSDPLLARGAFIEFNGLSEKEFWGSQTPGQDRDPVAFMREEDIFCVLRYEAGDKPKLLMLNDWILVRPDKRPAERNGLIVPGTSRAGPSFGVGEVIGAGRTVGSVEAGDRAVYFIGGATELKIGDFQGELHVCVLEEDVCAVIEP